MASLLIHNVCTNSDTYYFDGDSAEPAISKMDNWDGNSFTAPSTNTYMAITAPATGAVVAHVALSAAGDVDSAVKRAKGAIGAWSSMTVKGRAAIMFRFHQLRTENMDSLADLVVLENGKNKTEALGSVPKGNETVEWACSLPQTIAMQGKILEVSKGVVCHTYREPVGIIGCVVPFNFPAMVPMWTLPIALTTGNWYVTNCSHEKKYVCLLANRNTNLSKNSVRLTASLKWVH